MGKNSTHYGVRHTKEGWEVDFGNHPGSKAAAKATIKSLPNEALELIRCDVIDLDGITTTTEWEKVE